MSFGGFSEAFVNLYVAASKSLAFVFFEIVRIHGVLPCQYRSDQNESVRYAALCHNLENHFGQSPLE